MLQQTAAAAERVFEFLTEAGGKPGGKMLCCLSQKCRYRRGMFEFDHVAFSYEPEKPVIRDLQRHQARSKSGDCRTDWCRKINHNETTHALLRC